VKRSNKHAEKDNSERWLLSYADFITLLMVFFVILYSMSTVTTEKYNALLLSFSEAMGGVSGTSGTGVGTGPGASIPPDIVPPTASPYVPPPGSGDQADQAEQKALEAVQQKIEQALQEYGLLDTVRLSIDDRGLVIILADVTTFESGSADIMPSFIPELVVIANILSDVDNYIRIEGHTDNVPTGNLNYPSNWELSTARATTLVQLFVHNSSIDPGKLSAVGYGEYRPIASNDTVEGRAQNRRVEIIVVRSKYNVMETAGGVVPAQ